MGPYGSWSSWVLVLMVLTGPFWSFRVVMGPYGSLWVLVGPCRFLWVLMCYYGY